MKLEKEKTLEERYNIKNNSFDYVRIFFAFLVIMSHSLVIFHGPGYSNYVNRIALLMKCWGSIAVMTFFILSGFFTTQSILYSKNNKQFLMKRIIRVFPTLIVMLLLTIFVLVPIVTGEQIIDVVKNTNVWKYFFGNLNFFGQTQYSIDDVFANNPFPMSINGSIWTIKHEFILYIVLVIFSMCKIIKNRKIMLGITIASIYISVSGMILTPRFNFMNHIGIFLEMNSFIKHTTYFMIGCCIYLYKDKIKLCFHYFVFAILVLIFGFLLNQTIFALHLTMPYIIMYLGTIELNKNFLNKIGDFSYALYIYAFPIQQLVVYYYKDYLNFGTYILVCIFITTIISLINTLIIDNNVKKLKNKLFKKTKSKSNEKPNLVNV